MTPFEEHMFFDDVPEYPMTGFFRLRFSGCLQAEALDAAIQTTVSRHPLVRSRIVRNAQNELCWELTGGPAIPLAAWSADRQAEFPAGDSVDLTQSIGTRIWLVTQKGAHDLVVQIHHACTDALGMCHLIDDLLVSYAQLLGDVLSHTELRPLNNDQLWARNSFGLTWRRLLQLLPKHVLGLGIVGRFFLRRAVPLRLHASDQSIVASATFPAVCVFEFNRLETERLLSGAKDKQVTVNDLIARDLFLAIDLWRRQSGVGTPSDWIRLFVPINERTPDDRTLSAANVMSAVFLERTPRQMTNAETLLRSIQSEMRTVKRARLGLLLIATHWFLRRVPRLRNLVIRRAGCLASCVFSNLGIVLSQTPLPRQDGQICIGDVRLEGVEFFAPLRPLTHVTICIVTYAERLSVDLQFDPRAISRPQAEQLLACVVERIRESMRSDDAAEGATEKFPLRRAIIQSGRTS